MRSIILAIAMFTASFALAADKDLTQHCLGETSVEELRCAQDDGNALGLVRYLANYTLAGAKLVPGKSKKEGHLVCEYTLDRFFAVYEINGQYKVVSTAAEQEFLLGEAKDIQAQNLVASAPYLREFIPYKKKFFGGLEFGMIEKREIFTGLEVYVPHLNDKGEALGGDMMLFLDGTTALNAQSMPYLTGKLCF